MSRLVWTMAEVESRCEQEGDCLLWTRARNADGYPVANVAGKTRHMTRWVFTELLGRTVRPGEKVTTKCRNLHCLAEGCLTAMSRGRILSRSYAIGTRLPSTELANRRRLARDRGLRKMTEEIAAEIRSRYHERTADLAAEFGVSATTINKVKNGSIWNPVVPGASVFNWRPA